MQIGLAGIFQNVALVGHEDDETFGFRPLFEGKDFFYCLRVGGVAADAPDSIGGIEDKSSSLQDGETAFYIGFEILTGFHGSKNSNFGKNYIDGVETNDRGSLGEP